MSEVEDTRNFPTADSIESPAPSAVGGEMEAMPAASPEALAVEAVLFSADRPLAPRRISDIAALDGVRTVRQAVAELNGRYERDGRSFRIVEIAGGYQMQTLPEFAELVARLHTSRSEARLSQAALETLAIVAYRQPVLRADVEAIRGVACGEVLRKLMEKNLVRIAGRAEEIGRPMLYGTTNHFLEVFGLAGLKDLPDAEALRQPVAAPAPKAEAPAEGEGEAPEEGEGEAQESAAEEGEGQAKPLSDKDEDEFEGDEEEFEEEDEEGD